MTGTDPPTFVRPDWDGWIGPSSDPNDAQFGDVAAPISFEDRADADAVLVGEPYDGAVIGRRGAREGPVEIRRSLAGAKAYHFEGGAVPARSDDGLRVGDLGDLALDSGDTDVQAVQRRVRGAVAPLHEADVLPLFLGGDNSLTYANVAPLLDGASVGAVNFDAHLDCREPVDGPSSGTPYRQLLEAGLDAYVCVGARHFETSGAYVDYVDERGGEVVAADTVGRSPSAAVERVGAAVSDVDRLYVSVDCDVLDAAAAPGVSAPTPGGLSTRELFDLLSTLCEDDRLAGVEVVECSPPLDTGRRTVDAAARAVAHALAGYAEVVRS